MKGYTCAFNANELNTILDDIMSKVKTFFVAGLGNVCEFLKRNPWQQNNSRDALTTLYVPSLFSSQTPSDHMGCFEICVTGTCEGYPRDPYCLCCLRTTVIYVTHLKEYHSTICLAMRQSWRLGVQMIFIIARHALKYHQDNWHRLT